VALEKEGVDRVGPPLLALKFIGNPKIDNFNFLHFEGG